ncbi:hypothetical protein P3X46_023894 [Hevea brasiliensis]|uniref:Uncharacterized protein n=1 Tax=Hevea brasiliensis TaxID=3981 RepID=A0ABQ9LCH7_HEVBR|nr:uncharacterized protein LOC110635551 [Hevea brasiliensis]KAJ9164298.1 hypothetical protein P3X46_023894 [Hevea brasiliensis]
MPRSSRHKSSKHSSRDARDYSDSEKDSCSKDRKSKEESTVRVSKDSGSGEKRKLDSRDNKDSFGSGNGEYLEEYSSSKRFKERAEDGVNDRWNGGDDDKGEVTKKLKEKSGESRSKRRDESAGAYGESEEVVKKSSGKSDGKHRESSSRKEGREGGTERDRDREREREKERDRRGKEGKSDKLVDGEDLRAVKQVSEKTELKARDLLQSNELESLPDKRIRRKQDGSGDGDKHQDDIEDINDRRFSSREDGRPKDEKHKDERYRDKYREDKYRDERALKDHINSRSDDKNLRDDKDTIDIKPKKYKLQDGDREHDHDRDFDLGWDHDQDVDGESHHRDWDRDRDRDRDRDHDRDRDWDRDRDRERERDHERDRDRHLDYDDRSAIRYKDSRGRKISPDDHEDYNDAKSRGVKTLYLDMEKKSSSSSRVESDADRGRSQSRQAHPDNNTSSNRKRASPNTSSHGAADEYRQFKPEELKHRDAVVEQRSKSISSREANNLPGASDRASKYRSAEKPTKVDDGHIGELSLDRSSRSKASPMGLVDRSPTSSSVECRSMNRSGVRRSVDIEESGRRSSVSMGARDLPYADDRSNRDLPSEKSLADESTSVDSSFYNRHSQSNSALIPPSAFRGGVGSPSFLGSLDEDGRIKSGARYKRSADPNMGRGQGNAWRGAPNWSSSVPNGYIPFQHGPPHGGFQAMMPQFPSPPVFGVRPSMDISHSGIPYHIPDAERFSSHLRPLGWQNMMEGSGPSHMHGWDGSNGVFRDESHMYGGPEWDQSRHPMNGRGWENSADIWKVQNGDMNMDLPSTSLKVDFPVQAPMEDVLAGQEGQKSQNESSYHVQGKIVETKIAVAPSTKESSKSSPETTYEQKPDHPKLSSDDNVAHFYCAYLSKLDISTELTDPELHNQYMNLFNIEQSATSDEDTAFLVNLKDGARAVPKSSDTLLSSLHFPATSDTVFQRAMDIYKRQRVGWSLPRANSGTIDVRVPVNDVIAGEAILDHNAEMSDAQMLNVDEEKVEVHASIATEEENSEVACSLEVDVHAHTSNLKFALASQAASHDIPEKPTMIFNGDKVDGKSNEIVNSEDKQMEGCNNTFDCAEEGQGVGDAICGPVIFSDGSPKAFGALMPRSNESESVILSRIHHSLESTH